MPMEIRPRVGNVTPESEPEVGTPHRSAAPTVDVSRATGIRALLAVAAAVLAFQWVQGINGDTSWLLIVAEKWLGGARPYVDILELNPPASVITLMPAVLLGRLIGAPPEPILVVMTVLAASVAVQLSLNILSRSSAVTSRAQTRLVLAFMLLVLPMSVFAEREHLAVIGMTLLWSLMVVRAENLPVPAWSVVIAGLGAALALALKPQFGLLILMPALVVAHQRWSFAALFLPEYLIAAAGVAAYAGAVMVLFPAYMAQMAPLVLDLYVPVRESPQTILLAPQIGWACVAIIGLLCLGVANETRPAIGIGLMAALGGFLIVLWQGKGFAYHYYPAVAAAVPALADQGLTLANRRFSRAAERSGRPVAALGFVLIAVGLAFATLSFLGMSKPMAGLMAPIRAIAAHPRLMTISPHMWIGHPLARDVEGTWVGSVPSQWMTIGALYKLGLHPEEDEARRLSAAIDADRARAANDIARGKPDVIIVERDELVLPAWFSTPQEMREFLAGYQLRYTYVGVELWVREGLAQVLPGQAVPKVLPDGVLATPEAQH